MGMIGLETYLLKYHSASCPKESISTLVEKFRQETGSREVVAVFDANYIHREVLWGLDNICGGQFQEYALRLEVYIKRFTDLGIKPVFYFDGTIDEKKRRCWVNRKYELLDKVDDLYHYVSRSNSADPRKAWKDTKSPYLPNGIYESTIITLKQLGFEIKNALGDADMDIARYARENGCFAIFSRDTDFVALRGARYYLSAFHFHLCLDNMSTYHFDRSAIAASLRLDPEQLPLLCAMLPGDWVDGSYLVPLYRKLMGTASSEMSADVRYDLVQLVPELVWFIKRDLGKAGDPVAAILKKTFDGCSPFLLRRLAMEIMGPDAKPMDLRRGLQEQLETTLVMLEYRPVPTIPQAPSLKTELDLAREMHIGSRFLQTTVFSLLDTGVISVSVNLEDRVLPPSCCSETALRPLRRRMYGLLGLKEATEWYAPCTHPDAAIKPTTVTAERPDPATQPHPGLAALWTSLDDDVEEARWRLFAWALAAHRSPDLPVMTLAEDLQFLNKLDPELVLPTAMMYSLYHSGALEGMGERPEHLVRLLAQTCLQSRSLLHEPPRELRPSRYDEVGVHLGALYMTTYEHVTTLNDILGTPIPLLKIHPESFMNGRLLHKLYLGEEVDIIPKYDLDVEEKMIRIACKSVDDIREE